MKKIIMSAVLLLMAAQSYAISLQDLQVKELDKIAMTENVDYNDGSLINLKYTGSEATGIVYVSTGLLSIDAPSGTALVSSVPLAGTAYDTLGELCDYLDAQTNVACTLTGGKRDDSSLLLWNDGTSNTAGYNIADADGYSILIGTGTAGTDQAETIAYTMRIGITPQSGRRVLLKYCNVNVNVADADGLIVYGKLAKYEGVSDGVVRNDTTKVIGSLATADDTTETNGNVYDGYWAAFAKDAHVVISAGSGTGTQAASTNFLQCFWDER